VAASRRHDELIRRVARSSRSEPDAFDCDGGGQRKNVDQRITLDTAQAFLERSHESEAPSVDQFRDLPQGNCADSEPSLALFGLREDAPMNFRELRRIEVPPDDDVGVQ
jgi:hypothetical protein